jgi:SAM-dependent methyltransferase
MKDHWNNTYSKSTSEKLGWFETDLSPTLRLITKAGIKKTDLILNVGSGNTTLIDKLLEIGHTNLIATDISDISLQKLKDRLGERKIDYIVDDLTNSEKLNKIAPVKLWIDRAVLHFFTDDKDQDSYFKLLQKTVVKNGFVILAEYNLNSASKCAGLPVHRYSKELLMERLEPNFDLIESFEYIFTMHSGDKRPYIYALFKKL